MGDWVLGSQMTPTILLVDAAPGEEAAANKLSEFLFSIKGKNVRMFWQCRRLQACGPIRVA